MNGWSASGEPRVVARQCGGFLALTKEGEHPAIGVEGDTEAAARDAYARELAEWRILYEKVALDRKAGGAP